MADNLGTPVESLTQKRSWVSCQSPDDTKSESESFHGVDQAIPFTKRSRSQQEFALTHNHSGSTSEFIHQHEQNSGNGKQTDICANTQNRSVHPLGKLVDNDLPGVIFTIGDTTEDTNEKHCVGHGNPDEDAELQRSRSEMPQTAEVTESSEDSEMSDSSVGGTGWRPMKGPISWVQQQMSNHVDPYDVLHEILPDQAIPSGMNPLMLWKLIINIVSEPRRRKKLKDVNTLDQVVSLIHNSKKIVVLTGAGVSVSCGIPDFRSRDGIYSRLSVEYPDLPDPQAMFDIRYFKNNPKPFFKFAKEIYPGQFEPSKSHKFIQLIEAHNKLLRNYTQNIDTLEQVAGIKNVIQCHGSFATATCMVCKYKTDSEAIRDDIMNQIIPHCPKCPKDEELAILKPDIVFFGESLPSEFHDQMDLDKDVCDLLLVIGSSLKVRPVALIPNSLSKHVPQVLINRETLKHLSFDVELLGDCDVILQELCLRLDTSWHSICTSDVASVQVSHDDMSTPSLGSVRTPPHHPTPPNSEDNTRMSFQLGSEDNSCMSVTQEPDSLNTNRITQTINETDQSPSNFNTNNLNGDSAMSFEETESQTSCEKVSPPPTSQTACETIIESKSMDNLANSTKLMCTTDSSDTKKSDMGTDNVNTSENKSTLDNWRSDSESTSESQKHLDELRACWKPRLVNMAAGLKENEFLFLPPNRYVFKGAEVYNEDFDESSSSGSSDESFDGRETTSTNSKPSHEETEMDNIDNHKDIDSHKMSKQGETENLL